MIAGLAVAALVPAHFDGELLGPPMGKVGETPKRSGGGELGRRGEQLACEPSPRSQGAGGERSASSSMASTRLGMPRAW